jgi:cyclic beta-1,2-glucan synthetase
MILNNEQLRARGHEFALTHELYATNPLTARFWPAFRKDMAGLHAFAERLSNNKVHCKQPAEDWLLDHINFLETQAQAVMRNLPRATLQKLPRLRSTGMPRIYALCNDYLEHVDGRYDVHSFENYIQAYQEVSVLKDMECWALPSAMRVIIIRRLAAAMLDVRHRHEVCDSIASLLERIGAKNLSDTKIRILLEQEASKKPLGPIEIVHFVRHLSEWEPDIRIVRDWLAAHVENSESSLEQIVSFEHQLQAELQVTCGNLVQSLHILERQPWRLTFTKISHVEQILLSDTISDYEDLDLASRDVLRGRVAEIANQLNVPETLVAQTVLRLTKSRIEDSDQADLLPRKACVAYYLLDSHGIMDMRTALLTVTRPRNLPHIAIRRQPLFLYLSSSILLFVGLMFLAGAWISSGASIRPVSWLAIIAALFLPVSEWVITIVHKVICRYCRPTQLLRYDFSENLPEAASTMVVMPVIWSSIEEVDEVINRLLIHYLANRQKNIYFGVLADFTDASTETKSDDWDLVTHAVTRIDALCKEYGDDKFFLFHRSRLYNPVDKIYMGWERKRGKLVEFVELLSGSDNTSFTTIHGEKDILQKIRYVFTADQDTQLPIGVVSRMAGTIYYPYNRPRLNESETRVIEGFGVLQPRIGVNFESTQKSRFASLWAGEPGIDPYSFAVSNAYQDLFGHAIFVGKGIFDVEAFRKTIVSRIPEHHVLSHDLLEGGFLRTGLTSDIEVVESYPSTFYAYERRVHRWIRGDWQLIKWLGNKCKDRHGEIRRVDLYGLTRWQIIDNLRRSLLAPGHLLIALLGLNVLPGRGWVWETIVLLTIFLPFLFALIQGVIRHGSSRAFGVNFMQSAVQLITLPFAAVLTADAIFRTLYRLFISRRNLLEWVTFAQTDRSPVKKRVFMYEQAGYVVIALFVILAWLFGGILDRGIGIVVLVLWLLARPIIRQLNRPRRTEPRMWLNGARSELKELALQIWSFYDKYVTQDESWLPPDNVQYHPKEVVAHRTSPTNIGLYLSCVVAARDLDFIDTPEMINRIEASMKTLAGMEKWNGHLLNWYDTCSAEPLLPRYVSTVDSGNFVAYLMVVRQGLLEWKQREEDFHSSIENIMSEIVQLIEQTDFKSLYNTNEHLFCLGYHVDTNQKDTILYDLLASEARQASFVAIALGQIPVSHWFTLGRTMTIFGKCKTLLSWSGTMFEYLMPSLIMRTYRNTIWDSTYRGAIHRQRKYADRHQLPFGISESGYYAFDYQLNYQYRAFGVPGLGLERGLERNLVLAPYAAIMALPYAGDAGLEALRKFEDYGAKGEYGFYEAVDFTKARMPKGKTYQVVQSFMAHHQGMSMLTLVNLLTDEIMVKRFHTDPRVCATDLLLQERVPVKAALIEKPLGLDAKAPEFDSKLDDTERTFTGPTAVPEVNVLSNGRITSVNTNDGTGMLIWNGLAVTRWREDPVLGTSGPIVYIHDVTREKTWNTTRFPCETAMDTRTLFRIDKSAYEGSYDSILSKLELTISSDVDAEVRRLQVVNNSSEDRTLEVTSFLELALASQSADSAHPAFSKLFIETSHDIKAQCLLAKRRPREDEEDETWAAHTIYVDGRETGDYEFETDRAEFIGRGNTLQAPKAIYSRLRGSTGSVVDPAFIMRRCIQLAPKESATIYIVTGVAESREQALDIVQRLGDPKQADRTFHLAWVRSQIDLRQLHLTPKQASDAHLLAGRLLFTPPLTHVRRDAISQNTLGQSSLWPHGISGDAPIVLISVKNEADLPFVILLACQHQYLCTMGLAVDLVILDETIGGYQDQFMNRLRENLAARGIGQMKRIVGLKASQLPEHERTLLIAVARVLLRAGGPTSLRSQLRVVEDELQPVPRRPVSNQEIHREQQPSSIAAEGEFFNGWGSFIEDGRAYQIHVRSGAHLPKPWSNVLANPRFGCILTELGTGYSWWRNSRECKLTPWTNDPVLDQPGECLYLRDLDTNQVWSAAPKPAGDDRTYKVTHGWGYSRIEQQDGDVLSTMETTVPLNDPLKLIRLRLCNTSEDIKRISITYYAEWVLGVLREAQAPFIITEWDKEHSTLLARNTYQETFRDAVGFMHIGLPDPMSKSFQPYSWTGDRTEFISHGGTLECPAAILEENLSRQTGTFSNSCGAVQTIIELPAKGEITISILLGCAASKQEVYSLVHQYGQPSAYEETHATVIKYWERILGQVQVKTPDRQMDVMMNGWLLYQALTCRLWARTAFYQAGGAFGFRDQLQDSLAFLHVDPSIIRNQILINAAHQYQEGDVQHWWHEETHKGIRTRFSDDLLWLPYAVSRYLEQTEDLDILKQEVPFLYSDVLNEGELERYEDTVVSDEKGSLLEHCLRAIRHALKFGEHGIPLMGIGDWNDGMSRIGAKGRGESVWLGWFLLDILKRFIRLGNGIISLDVVEQFEQAATKLEQNMNDFAWDGAWFRRAFTDAGTWVGSMENKECRIDAIAQSWAVISKGTFADRQERAMRSFDRELVDRDLNLARLLTKAFDETRPSPGYIQGYPPGIRENGGQYTHGVIWGIVAWAMLGRRDKAFELFSMLNPISHTRTSREVKNYGNEPYVMSADVYTANPHQGQAGWSWYTGAAGWMYQAGLEYVLGIKCRGDRLYIQPCVPIEWKSFSIDYRFGESIYSIEVCCGQNQGAPLTWVVDGKEVENHLYLQLVDDGKVHQVVVQASLLCSSVMEYRD